MLSGDHTVMLFNHLIGRHSDRAGPHVVRTKNEPVSGVRLIHHERHGGHQLVEGGFSELKKILTHNNNFALINIGSRISDTWNTNKAVLVSKLSFDDISAINAFIASYSRLRDLHQGAIKIYEAGASSKAEEFQKRICESLFINNADDITKSASSKHPSFVAYNAHSFVFSPLHYIDDAINVLNNQENFIQTPAFRNLSLLAQRSRRWFIFKRK